MKNLLIVLIIFFSGCAFYRVTTITLKGKDIKSVYGKGDAAVRVQTNTVFYIFQ